MKLQTCTSDANLLTLLLADIDEEKRLFSALERYAYTPEEHSRKYCACINELQSQIRNTQKGLRGVELDIKTAKILLRAVFECAVSDGYYNSAFDYSDSDQLTLQCVDNEPSPVSRFPSGRYSTPPTDAYEFLKRKGIGDSTVKWLFAHNNLWQKDDQKCCFPIKNEYGEDIGAEVWDMKAPLWNTEGTDTRFGYMVCVGAVEDDSPIWFFDNAVNLLLTLERNCYAWKEQGEAVRLVSMGGLSFSVIKNYAELYSTANIFLSADNRNKQFEFTSTVTKFLNDKGITVEEYDVWKI